MKSNSEHTKLPGLSCSIAAVGMYVPEKILTNLELEKMVDTSDEWITSRTGISERRVAAAQESTSDMAASAARHALDKAGLSPLEIDLIVVATITPDMLFPATACLVQEKIGARNAIAFDLEAACSGFIYAMEVGRQFIHSGSAKNVLVIGAEKLSSIIDWTDRNTCVLFGDGAGAAVLTHRPQSRGIISTCLGSDGGKSDLLSMPGGGSRFPATPDSISNRLHFLRMDGKETFKNAVQSMHRASVECLEKVGMCINDVDCFIPHQANQRIVDAVGERLGASKDQVFVNLSKYGNTSAASVAIAMSEADDAGVLKRGDLLLMVVFGAGLTWGATLLEW